jgi:hypothetical protein
MENPATWGAAERAIQEVVVDHFASLARGEIGLSLPRKIADRLREAGLLLPEHNHITADIKEDGSCPRCAWYLSTQEELPEPQPGVSSPGGKT